MLRRSISVVSESLRFSVLLPPFDHGISTLLLCRLGQLEARTDFANDPLTAFYSSHLGNRFSTVRFETSPDARVASLQLIPASRARLLLSLWQNATLIERLCGKWSTQLILSQSKAKSFWNPKSLNAGYAKPKNSLSPILGLKPFGKQPVEKAGEIPFAFLSADNVFLCEGDGISGLALWLPAGSFSFSPSGFHLKKYVSFLLTDSEYIRMLSIVNMKQLSKQKQALMLAALREGAPLNSVTRMLDVSIHTVLRVIRDTGEAFADGQNLSRSAMQSNRDG